MVDAFIFRECKGKRACCTRMSTRKEEKERKIKENVMEALYPHINQSRLELLAREFARLIIEIDFIAVSVRIEINIFNCMCER